MIQAIGLSGNWGIGDWEIRESGTELFLISRFPDSLVPGHLITRWPDNGLIDDVRIYNYARTASQIMEDYNQGMVVKLGD